MEKTSPNVGSGSNLGSAHEVINTTLVGSNAAFTDWTTERLQALILAMPRRYRAITNGLKFYAGTDTFANIVKNNATVYSTIGSTEGTRGEFIGGANRDFRWCTSDSCSEVFLFLKFPTTLQDSLT